MKELEEIEIQVVDSNVKYYNKIMSKYFDNLKYSKYLSLKGALDGNDGRHKLIIKISDIKELQRLLPDNHQSSFSEIIELNDCRNVMSFRKGRQPQQKSKITLRLFETGFE